MIVTLAGHVDHGKTSLVKALTGTDTDRLAEEKRRGLTIELGFAYLDTGADAVPAIGFVDVPGHHRFVHNMLAGVSATQYAMLVIGADDGPMPQSREHLHILELLGIERGLVVLTKCDRVTPERIAEARREIAALVGGTFLKDAPVLQTSIDDPASVAAVRDHLVAVAESTPAEAASDKPFRLAVDRAFNLKGTGLVCTGTVSSGSVAAGETLYVYPGGQPARLRGLRVQNRMAPSARGGDRAALNLTGVDADSLSRGCWLTSRPEPGHRSLVVDLRLLPDLPHPVRHLSAVHVYLATSHSTARIAPFDGRPLDPGTTARVELLLDTPLPGKRGDRVLVRDHALSRTLGGGEVIDNRAPSGRRRSAARARSIDACGADDPGRSLDELLALGPVEEAQFLDLWPVSEATWRSLAEQRKLHRHDGQVVTEACWNGWRTALAEECRTRHTDDPALGGLRENDFHSAVPESWRGRTLAELTAAGILEQQAGRFRPPGHAVELSSQEQSLLQRLLPLLDQPQPPSLGDLGKTLQLPLARLQAGVRALAAKHAVVLVGGKRVFLPARLSQLADIAESMSASGPFSAREFRDRTGVGRNIAIDVLEHFDARGFTRRQGDTRTVVGQRSRLDAALG